MAEENIFINKNECLERIIRLKEVVAITGRSPASIWRDEQKGIFPSRVRLGENSVGWKSSDIQKWIANRERVTSANCTPVAPGAKRGRKPRNEGA